MMKPTRFLRAVSPDEAAKRGGIHSTVAPIIRDQGGPDYACPDCGIVLLEGWSGRIKILGTFICPRCGTVSTLEPPLQ